MSKDEKILQYLIKGEREMKKNNTDKHLIFVDNEEEYYLIPIREFNRLNELIKEKFSHWNYYTDLDYIPTNSTESSCDNCHFSIPFSAELYHMKYCPNCKCRMENIND